MTNLPSSSVKPAPQFSYCAVDYFGPWYVKEYTELYLPVWLVVRYMLKLPTPWQQIHCYKHYCPLPVREDRQVKFAVTKGLILLGPMLGPKTS